MNPTDEYLRGAKCALDIFTGTMKNLAKFEIRKESPDFQAGFMKVTEDIAKSDMHKKPHKLSAEVMLEKTKDDEPSDSRGGGCEMC